MAVNPYNSGLSPYGGAYANASSYVSNSPDATTSPLSFRTEKPASIERFSGDIFTPSRMSADPSKPDLTFKNFSEMTPQAVRSKGDIRGMVFDVDDTLSKFQLGGERTIPPELVQQLKTLQDSGIQLGIVSNNPDSKLVQKLQSDLADNGVEVAVISNGQKPSTKGLEMMQEYMGLPASQMMMVGDNPDTDVASGKRAGFKTAQVDWFNTSELHKAGMEVGDKVLNTWDKFKSVFDSNADQPQFFPPLHGGPAVPVSA